MECFDGPFAVRLFSLLQSFVWLPINHMLDILKWHFIGDYELQIVRRPFQIQIRLVADVLLQVEVQAMVVLETLNIVAFKVVH